MASIVIVTAPSGCGKTTLINGYIKKNKDVLFAISHTTREKRKDEEDGTHYHFVDVKIFEAMIQENKFIEWAKVHDNYYGTSKEELEKGTENKTIILDIDVQGALALQKINVEALYIFIKPPSIKSLKERLIKRNSDKEDTIEKRIWNAKRELEYEYAFNTVIINEQLDKTQKIFDETISNYKKEPKIKHKESK